MNDLNELEFNLDDSSTDAAQSNQATANAALTPGTTDLFNELSKGLQHYLQLPEHLVQAALLGATASAAQGAYNLKLPDQEGTPLSTPLSLHVLITASPNQRLHNLMSLLFAPHREFEKKRQAQVEALQQEQQGELAAWTVEYKTVTKLLEESARKLASREAPTPEQEKEHESIKRRLAELEKTKPTATPPFQLLYNNTTPKELTKAMSRGYLNATLVNQDAGETLMRWLNEDMSQFTQIWQGLPIQVDYAKDKRIDLPDARISSVMVAEEAAIHGYLEQHCSQPQEGDWIHHYLFYQHRPDPSEGNQPASPAPTALLNEYSRVITQLLEKSEQTHREQQERELLVLSAEADQSRKVWKQQILAFEPDWFDMDFIPGMKKGLIEQSERCAALIYLLNKEHAAISKATYEAALNLVINKLRGYALDLILPRMQVIQNTEALARLLIQKMLKENQQNYFSFSREDLMSDLNSGLKKPGALDEALKMLLKMGHVIGRSGFIQSSIRTPYIEGTFQFAIKPAEVPLIKNKGGDSFFIRSLPHADWLYPFFEPQQSSIDYRETTNPHYQLMNYTPLAGQPRMSGDDPEQRYQQLQKEYENEPERQRLRKDKEDQLIREFIRDVTCH